VLNGLNMGNRQHSRKAMGAMVDVTFKSWFRDFQHHVQQPHPISGHKIYIGTMVDKVTDLGTKQPVSPLPI
jgi:hypothetical protein